jgi:acetyl-CoA acetyltransferase
MGATLILHHRFHAETILKLIERIASLTRSTETALRGMTEARTVLVIAGGTESMTNVPFLWNQKAWFRSSLLKPIPALELALTDPTCGLNMGQTAEVLAKEFGIDAIASCDPRRMGLGPVFAIHKLFSRTGFKLVDFELVEFHDAFAVQVLACGNAMASDRNPSQSNHCRGTWGLSGRWFVVRAFLSKEIGIGREKLMPISTARM